MQQFTTQFTVSQKQENIDGNNALQFTLNITPDQQDVSGYLIITTLSQEADTFFKTGDTYDVVITPHIEE